MPKGTGCPSCSSLCGSRRNRGTPPAKGAGSCRRARAAVCVLQELKTEVVERTEEAMTAEAEAEAQWMVRLLPLIE